MMVLPQTSVAIVRICLRIAIYDSIGNCGSLPTTPANHLPVLCGVHLAANEQVHSTQAEIAFFLTTARLAFASSTFIGLGSLLRRFACRLRIGVAGISTGRTPIRRACTHPIPHISLISLRSATCPLALGITRLAAALHLIPTVFPLLAPRKRTIARYARLHWQVVRITE